MAKILMALVIAAAALWLLVYPYSHTPFHTYVGDMELSGKSRMQLLRELEKLPDYRVNIKIKDRIYDYSFRELGVIVDAKSTADKLLDKNIGHRYLAFWRGLKHKQTYVPEVIFSADFYRLADKSIFEIGNNEENIGIDNQNKTILYEAGNHRYRLNAPSLKMLIGNRYGYKNQMLEPQLDVIESPKETLIKDYNRQLSEAFSRNVTVIAEDGSTHTAFNILPAELKRIVIAKYDPAANSLQYDIDETALRQAVGRVGIPVTEKGISIPELENDILSVIKARTAGNQAAIIQAKIDYRPNSDGSLGDKYIEIDLSQQRMYLFRNGSVFASYPVSSGRYFPTPTGSFRILNKSPNAYSNIYHVWMPYWMAFYYHPQVKAFFGIHELPYWIAGNGQKIQRPREFIGSPNTGGCVALDIDTAKEVYLFSEVGMPVHIFD